VTLATQNFPKKILSGFMWGALTPNLMFVSFAVAFNLQILWGHVTLTTPPFTLFGIQGLTATKRRHLNYKPL